MQIGVASMTPNCYFQVIFFKQLVNASYKFLQAVARHNAVFDNWQRFVASVGIGNQGGGTVADGPQALQLIIIITNFVGGTVVAEDLFGPFGVLALFGVVELAQQNNVGIWRVDQAF